MGFVEFWGARKWYEKAAGISCIVCCCIGVILAIVLGTVLTIKLSNECRDTNFFDTAPNGVPVNLVAVSVPDTTFATLGTSGIGRYVNGVLTETIPMPDGQAANDLAVDEQADLLFIIDFNDGSSGEVLVYNITASNFVLQNGGVFSVLVPTGTAFTGIVASDGILIVSGGTDPLTVFEYNATTGLIGASASLDFFRGTPDIFLMPGSTFPRTAIVSTHFRGTPGAGADYGITILDVFQPPALPVQRGILEIDDTGFTRGVLRPSNWPTKSASLDENTVVVASCSGIQIIDITDRDNPRETASRGLSVSSIDVAADPISRQIFVVGSEPRSRLVQIDASNLPALSIVSDISTGGDATSVHFSDTTDPNSVFVALGGDGIGVFPRL